MRTLSSKPRRASTLRIRYLLIGAAGGVALASVALYPYLRRAPIRPEPGADGRSVLTATAPSAGALPAVFDTSVAGLHRDICKHQSETRDPTGSVRRDIDGELEALRVYEEIIREHPDWASEPVDEELAARIYTPKRVRRLRAAYQWVQGSLFRFLDSQPDTVFTPRERRQLKGRIAGIDLQLPVPAKLYADEPDLFTKTDVYFERTASGKMRLRVGGAFLLTSRSWFNQVFTLAHEIAHAFDPCELRQAHLSFPAFDTLSACFMAQGLVDVSKHRIECGENDQLSETFADWFAVQVSADALGRYATEFDGRQLIQAVVNTTRDLCDQDEATLEPDFSVHPTPLVRIEKIFGRHPVVRGLIGSRQPAGEPDYCDFNWISPKGL